MSLDKVFVLIERHPEIQTAQTIIGRLGHPPAPITQPTYSIGLGFCADVVSCAPDVPLNSDAQAIFGMLGNTDTNIEELGAIMAGTDTVGVLLSSGGELFALSSDVYYSVSYASYNIMSRIIEWQAGDLEGFAATHDLVQGIVSGTGPGPFTGPFPWGAYGWAVGCMATACWSNEGNPNQ